MLKIKPRTYKITILIRNFDNQLELIERRFGDKIHIEFFSERTLRITVDCIRETFQGVRSFYVEER